jgi:hypothetical protein
LVAETGSNTNMKEDGFAGGQLFALLVDVSGQGGRLGVVTDIHFTVLCFTSGRSGLVCYYPEINQRNSGRALKLENGY